jgi:AcrR family transcriptional regulator
VLSSVQPSFGEVNTAADLRAWCADAIRAHAASDDPIRCPIGSLVYELDRSDDGPARATLKSGFARWEQVIADALQRVADNGGLLPGTEPVVLAAAFLAAYQGGMLMADVSGDVAPLRHALDTALAAAVGLPTKRVRSR